ncbi:hypothetical protein BC941DRAFT_444666 [Chlamydoabsidia padenii]|nr:hypothetical protein BC941DRAFT_444666 [Chlamydoabsidia padenii]
MQFANNHFDFNTRFIQLPPLPTLANQQQSRFIQPTTEEWHSWVAAQTLLSLHHQYPPSSSSSSFPTDPLHSDTALFPSSTEESASSEESGPSSESASSSESALSEESASEERKKSQSSNDDDDDDRIRTTTTTHGVTKPRWSDEERAKLIQAVIQEKKLNDPTSFLWHRISLSVPHHSSRACQDRWFNDMLPILTDLYSITLPLP